MIGNEERMSDSNKPIRFSKLLEFLLALAGLAVIAINVVLLRQNLSLRQTLAPQITPGTRLENLSGVALDGRLQQLALPSGDSRLVIITFSPSCPACQANQEGWMQLASTLEQQGIRTLWVSRDPVDETKTYCVKHGMRLSNTLADPPYGTYLQLGLARVPNIVVVRGDSTVEKVWVGRLDQAGWDSIFTYFSERKEAISSDEVNVGISSTGCGSELSQTSAKGCK